MQPAAHTPAAATGIERAARRSMRVSLFALRDVPADNDSPAQEHTFRFASSGERQAMSQDARLPFGEAELSYCGRGDRCFVQASGKQVTGYALLAHGPLAHVGHGFHLNLADDVCFTYGHFSESPGRRGGDQAALDRAILTAVEAEGKRRLLRAVPEDNVATLGELSDRSYARIGDLSITRGRGRVRLVLTLPEDWWSTARRA